MSINEDQKVGAVRLTFAHSHLFRPIQNSALHLSPFYLLRVSSRDDRRKIVAQAESKSLEINHKDCQKARSDLINSRTRLTAEIAWFPGISPKKVFQLLDSLLGDAISVRSESDFPTLARCNLMVAAFEAITVKDTADDLAELIQEMARLVDKIDGTEVALFINEDRLVSGFPEIKGIDLIESEISERKHYFKTVIKDALNRLSSTSLLDSMTLAVDRATNGGEHHAPELIDELVDSYAGEIHGILEKESENVQKLIRAARDSVKSGEGAVRYFIEKIDRVARNWGKFAQPIQLSAKARGIEHAQSRDLAMSIRSFAIDLFNDHGLLSLSQRLTCLLQDLFSEVPDVSERIDKDAGALADIREKRKQMENLSSYSADVGIIFKDVLSISPVGIDWKGINYPLAEITGVRWGGTRHSLNGIPTGTDYQIAFSAKNGDVIIKLKKESTYTKFTNAMWRAVCIRLMINMGEILKSGKSLAFGGMMIEDATVTLFRHKFWSADEMVRLSWRDVHAGSANGSFIIKSNYDEKIYGSASYIDVWNTHILEHIVLGGLKKKVFRLSDYFYD